jgi:XisI protein
VFRKFLRFLHEGWEQDRRVHSFLVHAEIRNDKIWIHYDGIEDGITGELVAAKVLKDHIVLEFTPTPDAIADRICVGVACNDKQYEILGWAIASRSFCAPYSPLALVGSVS